MTVRWFSGGETGHINEMGGNNNGAIVSTPVRSGAYAVRTMLDFDQSFFSPAGLALPTMYLRTGFQVNLRTLPSAQATCLGPVVRIGGTNRFYFRVFVETTGTMTIDLWNTLTSLAVGSPVSILEDAWYLVELRVTINATTGILEWRLGGVVQGTTTNTNTGSTNVDQIHFASVKSVGNGILGDFYYDDMMIRDDAYPGDGKCLARQGTAGTPTYNAWTKTSAQTAAQVWSTTPFSATNEAHSTAINQAQTMLVAPFNATQSGHGTEVIGASDTINACKVGAVAKASVAGTHSLRRRIASVDTDTPKSLTTADLFYDDGIWTTTLANLNSSEIGGLRSATAGTEMTIEDAWMLVDFTPASVAPTYPQLEGGLGRGMHRGMFMGQC